MRRYRRRVTIGIASSLAMLGMAALCARSDAQGAGGIARPPEKAVTLDLGEGVTLKLALIPAGRFVMRSEPGRDGKGGAQRPVIIERPFYMGVHEVTCAQFNAVTGGHGRGQEPKDLNLPISSVSWEAAKEFCRRLSERTGRAVALPTEEQWKYACRAGTNTAYSFGDDARLLPQYARFGQRGNAGPLPVGSLKPNAWGLHDMHGNLAEWCENCAIRGGGWAMGADYVRSGSRSVGSPRIMSVDIGFRVTMAIDPPAGAAAR